jgi:hypothetical protein
MLQGLDGNFKHWTPSRMRAEIAVTEADISAALWNDGDVDLARVLISKRMGLRVCAGERAVRLKPVALDVLA